MSPTMARDPVALAGELRGIAKRYGGVEALAGVDLTIEAGRVHALVGENGAGTSTLMRILAGAETPDAGEVIVGGQPRHFRDVAEAGRAGVATVFQELTLFPHLDVLANIAAFAIPPGPLGRVERARMERLARPAMEELGLDVPLRVPVSTLALHERQLVEIARALVHGASILVLDEPNSALNAAESERLFGVIERLVANGTAVIHVSHRLEEVLRIADVVTVLRDGRVVTTVDAKRTSVRELVTAIVGHRVEMGARSDWVQVPASVEPSVVLGDVTVPRRLSGVSLELRPGEVVGLVGLEGAGQATVIALLFGRVRPSGGTLRVLDLDRAPADPREAVRHGIAYVPSDRRRDGVMLERGIGMNVSETDVGALGRTGVRATAQALDHRGLTWIERLGIVGGGPRTPVGRLSGGNQQKTVLARWLAVDPRLVLLEDPLRGVDVGAKAAIHELIRELAAGGRTVVFRSTELPDYANVCDRAVVFQAGRVIGDLPMAGLSDHQLLEAVNTGVMPGQGIAA